MSGRRGRGRPRKAYREEISREFASQSSPSGSARSSSAPTRRANSGDMRTTGLARLSVALKPSPEVEKLLNDMKKKKATSVVLKTSRSQSPTTRTKTVKKASYLSDCYIDTDKMSRADRAKLRQTAKINDDEDEVKEEPSSPNRTRESSPRMPRSSISPRLVVIEPQKAPQKSKIMFMKKPPMNQSYSQATTKSQQYRPTDHMTSRDKSYSSAEQVRVVSPMTMTSQTGESVYAVAVVQNQTEVKDEDTEVVSSQKSADSAYGSQEIKEDPEDPSIIQKNALEYIEIKNDPDSSSIDPNEQVLPKDFADLEDEIKSEAEDVLEDASRPVITSVVSLKPLTPKKQWLKPQKPSKIVKSSSPITVAAYDVDPNIDTGKSSVEISDSRNMAQGGFFEMFGLVSKNDLKKVDPNENKLHREKGGKLRKTIKPKMKSEMVYKKLRLTDKCVIQGEKEGTEEGRSPKSAAKFKQMQKDAERQKQFEAKQAIKSRLKEAEKELRLKSQSEPGKASTSGNNSGPKLSLKSKNFTLPKVTTAKRGLTSPTQTSNDDVLDIKEEPEDIVIKEEPDDDDTFNIHVGPGRRISRRERKRKQWTHLLHSRPDVFEPDPDWMVEMQEQQKRKDLREHRRVQKQHMLELARVRAQIAQFEREQELEHQETVVEAEIRKEQISAELEGKTTKKRQKQVTETQVQKAGKKSAAAKSNINTFHPERGRPRKVFVDKPKLSKDKGFVSYAYDYDAYLECVGSQQQSRTKQKKNWQLAKELLAELTGKKEELKQVFEKPWPKQKSPPPIDGNPGIVFKFKEPHWNKEKCGIPKNVIIPDEEMIPTPEMCVVPHMCDMCLVNDHDYVLPVRREAPDFGGCLHMTQCSHFTHVGQIVRGFERKSFAIEESIRFMYEYHNYDDKGKQREGSLPDELLSEITILKLRMYKEEMKKKHPGGVNIGLAKAIKKAIPVKYGQRKTLDLSCNEFMPEDEDLVWSPKIPEGTSLLSDALAVRRGQLLHSLGVTEVPMKTKIFPTLDEKEPEHSNVPIQEYGAEVVVAEENVWYYPITLLSDSQRNPFKDQQCLKKGVPVDLEMDGFEDMKVMPLVPHISHKMFQVVQMDNGETKVQVKLLPFYETALSAQGNVTKVMKIKIHHVKCKIDSECTKLGNKMIERMIKFPYPYKEFQSMEPDLLGNIIAREALKMAHYPSPVLLTFCFGKSDNKYDDDVFVGVPLETEEEKVEECDTPPDPVDILSIFSKKHEEQEATPMELIEMYETDDIASDENQCFLTVDGEAKLLPGNKRDPKRSRCTKDPRVDNVLKVISHGTYIWCAVQRRIVFVRNDGKRTKVFTKAGMFRDLELGKVVWSPKHHDFIHIGASGNVEQYRYGRPTRSAYNEKIKKIQLGLEQDQSSKSKGKISLDKDTKQVIYTDPEGKVHPYEPGITCDSGISQDIEQLRKLTPGVCPLSRLSLTHLCKWELRVSVNAESNRVEISPDESEPTQNPRKRSLDDASSSTSHNSLSKIPKLDEVKDLSLENEFSFTTKEIRNQDRKLMQHLKVNTRLTSVVCQKLKAGEKIMHDDIEDLKEKQQSLRTKKRSVYNYTRRCSDKKMLMEHELSLLSVEAKSIANECKQIQRELKKSEKEERYFSIYQPTVNRFMENIQAMIGNNHYRVPKEDDDEEDDEEEDGEEEDDEEEDEEDDEEEDDEEEDDEEEDDEEEEVNSKTTKVKVLKQQRKEVEEKAKLEISEQTASGDPQESSPLEDLLKQIEKPAEKGPVEQERIMKEKLFERFDTRAKILTVKKENVIATNTAGPKTVKNLLGIADESPRAEKRAFVKKPGKSKADVRAQSEDSQISPKEKELPIGYEIITDDTLDLGNYTSKKTIVSAASKVSTVKSLLNPAINVLMSNATIEGDDLSKPVLVNLHSGEVLADEYIEAGSDPGGWNSSGAVDTAGDSSISSEAETRKRPAETITADMPAEKKTRTEADAVDEVVSVFPTDDDVLKALEQSRNWKHSMKSSFDPVIHRALTTARQVQSGKIKVNFPKSALNSGYTVKELLMKKLSVKKALANMEHDQGAEQLQNVVDNDQEASEQISSDSLTQKILAETIANATEPKVNEGTFIPSECKTGGILIIAQTGALPMLKIPVGKPGIVRLPKAAESARLLNGVVIPNIPEGYMHKGEPVKLSFEIISKGKSGSYENITAAKSNYEILKLLLELTSQNILFDFLVKGELEKYDDFKSRNKNFDPSLYSSIMENHDKEDDDDDEDYSIRGTKKKGVKKPGKKSRKKLSQKQQAFFDKMAESRKSGVPVTPVSVQTKPLTLADKQVIDWAPPLRSKRNPKPNSKWKAPEYVYSKKHITPRRSPREEERDEEMSEEEIEELSDQAESSGDENDAIHVQIEVQQGAGGVNNNDKGASGDQADLNVDTSASWSKSPVENEEDLCKTVILDNFKLEDSLNKNYRGTPLQTVVMDSSPIEPVVMKNKHLYQEKMLEEDDMEPIVHVTVNRQSVSVAKHQSVAKEDQQGVTDVVVVSMPSGNPVRIKTQMTPSALVTTVIPSDQGAPNAVIKSDMVQQEAHFVPPNVSTSSATKVTRTSTANPQNLAQTSTAGATCYQYMAPASIAGQTSTASFMNSQNVALQTVGTSSSGVLTKSGPTLKSLLQNPQSMALGESSAVVTRSQHNAPSSAGQITTALMKSPNCAPQKRGPTHTVLMTNSNSPNVVTMLDSKRVLPKIAPTSSEAVDESQYVVQPNIGQSSTEPISEYQHAIPQNMDQGSSVALSDSQYESVTLEYTAPMETISLDGMQIVSAESHPTENSIQYVDSSYSIVDPSVVQLDAQGQLTLNDGIQFTCITDLGGETSIQAVPSVENSMIVQSQSLTTSLPLAGNQVQYVSNPSSYSLLKPSQCIVDSVMGQDQDFNAQQTAIGMPIAAHEEMEISTVGMEITTDFSAGNHFNVEDSHMQVETVTLQDALDENLEYEDNVVVESLQPEFQWNYSTGM